MVYGCIEAVSFGVDVVFEEVIPVAILEYGSLFQDGLGAGDGPSHAGVFHAIFDEGSTGTFDGAGGDGIALLQIGGIVHHMAVILEIGDGLLDDGSLVGGEWILGADLFECADDVAELALQEGV